MAFSGPARLAPSSWADLSSMPKPIGGRCYRVRCKALLGGVGTADAYLLALAAEGANKPPDRERCQDDPAVDGYGGRNGQGIDGDCGAGCDACRAKRLECLGPEARDVRLRPQQAKLDYTGGMGALGLEGFEHRTERALELDGRARLELWAVDGGFAVACPRRIGCEIYPDDMSSWVRESTDQTHVSHLTTWALSGRQQAAVAAGTPWFLCQKATSPN